MSTEPNHEAAGFSEATLKRARSKAGVDADRQGFGGGSVWSLADHSAHIRLNSAQVQPPEPNGLNGEPNGVQGSAFLDHIDARKRPRCTQCGDPMIVYEPGQTTHPGCADTQEHPSRSVRVVHRLRLAT